MFMAGMLDHLDEVDVVFPVPGQAEVVLHISIIREKPACYMCDETDYNVRTFLYKE